MPSGDGGTQPQSLAGSGSARSGFGAVRARRVPTSSGYDCLDRDRSIDMRELFVGGALAADAGRGINRALPSQCRCAEQRLIDIENPQVLRRGVVTVDYAGDLGVHATVDEPLGRERGGRNFPRLTGNCPVLGVDEMVDHGGAHYWVGVLRAGLLD